MSEINGNQPDDAIIGEIGRRLRETRLQRNLEQAEVATEAGIGRATVQRIEAGESASTTSLIRLLRALDLAEALDLLVPDPDRSPLQKLEADQSKRQRASGNRATAKTGSGGKRTRTWLWGDERGGQP